MVANTVVSADVNLVALNFTILQANGFNPSPVDTSNVVLSRELQVGGLTLDASAGC